MHKALIKKKLHQLQHALSLGWKLSRFAREEADVFGFSIM